LSELADAIVDRLFGASAMAHAASWALGWLSEHHYWHPTARQMQLIFAVLANPKSDLEAVRYLSWVMRNEKASDATELLIQWLGRDAPFLRQHLVEALGEIGNDAAMQAVFHRLQDQDGGVRGAALGALAKRDSSADAVLVSRTLNGREPFFDPEEPIPAYHASRAAATLGIPLDDARARYQALAARYNLKLAWSPDP